MLKLAITSYTDEQSGRQVTVKPDGDYFLVWSKAGAASSRAPVVIEEDDVDEVCAHACMRALSPFDCMHAACGITCDPLVGMRVDGGGAQDCSRRVMRGRACGESAQYRPASRPRIVRGSGRSLCAPVSFRRVSFTVLGGRVG